MTTHKLIIGHISYDPSFCNAMFTKKTLLKHILRKVMLWDFFSSAFALWANAELYILVPSLTYLLTPFLSFFLSPFLSPFLHLSGRKLEKSVNIDGRTLKFCMSNPQTQSLRFRENQIYFMSVSLLVGLHIYLN